MVREEPTFSRRVITLTAIGIILGGSTDLLESGTGRDNSNSAWIGRWDRGVFFGWRFQGGSFSRDIEVATNGAHCSLRRWTVGALYGPARSIARERTVCCGGSAAAICRVLARRWVMRAFMSRRSRARSPGCTIALRETGAPDQACRPQWPV